jgi:CheY-like chemotaxis protein
MRSAAAVKVLVVDDHLETLESMTGLLRFWGYQVLDATEGKEALAKTQLEKPEFVILDLGLPGMSGLEVAEEIRNRETLQRPTIIAHTGHNRPLHEHLTRLAGFDFMLAKPVSPEELKKVLEWFT